MSRDDLRLVHLPETAWHGLASSQVPFERYRYVVGETHFKPTWRVALVIVGSSLVGAAVVRRFGRPGRGQDGLEFDSAEAFNDVIDWDGLLSGELAGQRRHFDRLDGHALPPKAGADLEEALKTVSPDSADTLRRLRSLARSEPLAGPRAALIREQRDAVALGLEIAGISSRGLVPEAPDSDQGALSHRPQSRSCQ